MNTALPNQRSAARPGAGRQPHLLGARRGHSAYLMVELMVAMAIILLALVPVTYTFSQERQLALKYYQQAVAIEIVDGEMEVLRAGAWRSYRAGAQPYVVRAESAANLPPGEFVLTVDGNRLRLEWQPLGEGRGARVVREGVGR